MPIPNLDGNGLLPVGVHDCTLVDIREVFGLFRTSDRRIRLTAKLAEYLQQLGEAQIGRYLYVDGSYVTAKEEPDDIDLLLILREDVDLGGEVPPFEYNARSGKYVKKKFGFDFFFGFEGDPSADRVLSLFRRVKDSPADTEKGLLRVIL